MRYGFTTGSCAAAAAKASAYMLLTGKKKTEITIETPKGILYKARLLDICRGEREASCAVEKDGGDDPDITTGAWIYARVSYGEKGTQGILIEGGDGVGRVTRPGLDQPVGNAAINRIPREMIEKEVMEVCRAADYKGSLKIEIFVPGGQQMAEDTFNPRLGIEGGISILGTTGIVEPMSSQALLDTIKTELGQRRAEGFDYAAVSPGNYGLEFMRKTYGYDLDKSIKCSNFIGAAMDMAAELGFKKILLTGHIGKLIKVAGGIMNTHSKEADCRMELLAAFAVREQADPVLISRILDCITTEEAVRILEESGKLHPVMEYAAERICFYTQKRTGGRIKVDCILYTNEMGELAKSKGAEKMVYFVGAGTGAADLITVRGMRLLKKADVIIYAGSLVNPELLSYAGEGCEIHNSAYLTLEEILEIMKRAEAEEKTTVRLHTGDPSIYGAVREQMDELDKEGIRYESCPGVSACFGAAASLNLEYTLPGISQSLIITRMEGKTKVPERESLESLAGHQASMAIYLSAGMIEELSRRLTAGGYGEDTPAALVYKATWPEEEAYICTVGTLYDTAREHGITKTAVVLVGDVIAHQNYGKSRLYAADFSTGFRKAKEDIWSKTES